VLTCRKASKEDFNDSLIVEVCAHAAQAASTRGSRSVTNPVWLVLCDTALLGCWPQQF